MLIILPGLRTFLTLAFIIALAVSSHGQQPRGGPETLQWAPLGPLPGAASFPRSFSDTPADPSRVYVGLLSAVAVSDDGGQSWEHRYPKGNLDFTVHVSASPHDPDVALAGGYFGEVRRTDDAGRSWQTVRTETNAYEQFRVQWRSAFAPSDASRAYLISTDQILRSTDGGLSWETLVEGLVASAGVAQGVVVDAADANHVYVGVAGHGVYESIDGGDSWTLKPVGPGSWIFSLAIDPNNGQRLLVGAEQVYLSEDGGDTWTGLHPGVGSYADSVAFDGADPDTLYAGIRSAGVATTHDLGGSWSFPSGPGVEKSARLYTPALQAGSVVPERVLFGDAGGVFRSVDGAQTFERRNNGLESHAMVQDLVQDPFHPQRLLARTGGSIFRSEDAGATWRESVVPPYFASSRVSLAADPLVAGRFYAGSDNGPLCRSDDGGRKFIATPVSAPGGIGAILPHPTIRDRLLLLAQLDGSGLQLSVDAGQSTSPISSFGTYRAGHLTSNSMNPDVLYTSNWRDIRTSSDGGSTWSSWSRITTTGINDVLVDPTNPDRAYAACSEDGLYRTEDRGVTWTRMSESFFFSSDLTFGRDAPGALVANDFLNPRVHRSLDRGETAQRLGNLDSLVWTLLGTSHGLVAGTFSDGLLVLR